MSPVTALAALCGLLLGIGLWLVLVRIPPMRPISLTERIAPQLRAVDVQSRLLADARPDATPFGPLGRIIRPLLADAVVWSHRFNPAAATLARRLVQAGRGQSTTDFRAQQLLWAAAGLAGSTLVIFSPHTAARRGNGMPAAPMVAAGSATARTPAISIA